MLVRKSKNGLLIPDISKINPVRLSALAEFEVERIRRADERVSPRMFHALAATIFLANEENNLRKESDDLSRQSNDLYKIAAAVAFVGLVSTLSLEYTNVLLRHAMDAGYGHIKDAIEALGSIYENTTVCVLPAGFLINAGLKRHDQKSAISEIEKLANTRAALANMMPAPHSRAAGLVFVTYMERNGLEHSFLSIGREMRDDPVIRNRFENDVNQQSAERFYMASATAALRQFIEENPACIPYQRERSTVQAILLAREFKFQTEFGVEVGLSFSKQSLRQVNGAISAPLRAELVGRSIEAAIDGVLENTLPSPVLVPPTVGEAPYGSPVTA